MKLKRLGLLIAVLLIATGCSKVWDRFGGDFDKDAVAPARPQELSVLVLIDKSASMISDGKLDVISSAPVTIATLLRDNDRVAVLGFGDKPLNIISLTAAQELKTADNTKLAELSGSGGTDAYSALEAARMVLQSRATLDRRHILLLSDGHFPFVEPDLQELFKKLNDHEITLSCVGYGSGADSPVLRLLSGWGNGIYYQVHGPQGLRKVLRLEVRRLLAEIGPQH